MIEEVIKLCNKYYELIPRKEFAHDKLDLILQDYQVNQELWLIDEVFDTDIALKLLYGAYLQQKKVNPYDYIVNSVSFSLKQLPQNNDMYNLILRYMNTSSDNQEYFIENIFEYFGNNTDQ